MVPSGTTASVAVLHVETSSALCAPFSAPAVFHMPSWPTISTLPFSVNFTLLASGSVAAECAVSAVKYASTVPFRKSRVQAPPLAPPPPPVIWPPVPPLPDAPPAGLPGPWPPAPPAPMALSLLLRPPEPPDVPPAGVLAPPVPAPTFPPVAVTPPVATAPPEPVLPPDEVAPPEPDTPPVDDATPPEPDPTLPPLPFVFGLELPPQAPSTSNAAQAPQIDRETREFFTTSGSLPP